MTIEELETEAKNSDIGLLKSRKGYHSFLVRFVKRRTRLLGTLWVVTVVLINSATVVDLKDFLRRKILMNQ